MSPNLCHPQASTRARHAEIPVGDLGAVARSWAGGYLTKAPDTALPTLSPLPEPNHEVRKENAMALPTNDELVALAEQLQMSRGDLEAFVEAWARAGQREPLTDFLGVQVRPTTTDGDSRTA